MQNNHFGSFLQQSLNLEQMRLWTKLIILFYSKKSLVFLSVNASRWISIEFFRNRIKIQWCNVWLSTLLAMLTHSLRGTLIYTQILRILKGTYSNHSIKKTVKQFQKGNLEEKVSENLTWGEVLRTVSFSKQFLFCLKQCIKHFRSFWIITHGLLYFNLFEMWIIAGIIQFYSKSFGSLKDAMPIKSNKIPKRKPK